MTRITNKKRAQKRLDELNAQRAADRLESARARFGCDCMGCAWRAHLLDRGLDDPGHDDNQAALNCKNRETVNACLTCGHGEKFHFAGDKSVCMHCECDRFVPPPHAVR